MPAHTLSLSLAHTPTHTPTHTRARAHARVHTRSRAHTHRHTDRTMQYTSKSETEVADQTFYLTQSQYTDTGLTSPSSDPIMPGTWQGSHWRANF